DSVVADGAGIALRREPLAHEIGDALLVFDDQDAAHPRASCASGTSMPNRDPTGEVLRLTRPPCAFAIAATMGRPRPDPRMPRVAPTRPKRSKMRSSISVGMPGPWSATQNSTAESSMTRLPNEIGEPCGEYLAALSASCSHACVMRAASM